MKVLLWRICNRDFLNSAFSGEGTYKRGGRWNSPKRKIVYVSDSLALASREYLSSIPLAELAIPQLIYFQVEIEEDKIEKIDIRRLPKNWAAIKHKIVVQNIEDSWYDQKRSLAFCVPSAVIPVGNNFLINREHPDFGSLEISRAYPFSFDERTEIILAKAIITQRLEDIKSVNIRKR